MYHLKKGYQKSACVNDCNAYKMEYQTRPREDKMYLYPADMFEQIYPLELLASCMIKTFFLEHQL